MAKKIFIIFSVGLIEQLLYTFYLLSLNKYLIEMSSILMFSYILIYLGIINRIAKDKKDSFFMMLSYAISCGVGNYLAMILHVIK